LGVSLKGKLGLYFTAPCTFVQAIDLWSAMMVLVAGPD